MTDKSRSFTLPLNFLAKKTKYEATIYTDDDASLETATKIQIRKMNVDSSTVLSFDLKAKGGETIIFRKLKP